MPFKYSISGVFIQFFKGLIHSKYNPSSGSNKVESLKILEAISGKLLENKSINKRHRSEQKYNSLELQFEIYIAFFSQGCFLFLGLES